MGHHENIGKQNGRIGPEPLDRLQGYPGGPFRGVAKIEKAIGPGAHLPVFGKVATGLAHEPEWRTGSGLAGKSIEKKVGHSGFQFRGVRVAARKR